MQNDGAFKQRGLSVVGPVRRITYIIAWPIEATLGRVSSPTNILFNKGKHNCLRKIIDGLF